MSSWRNERAQRTAQAAAEAERQRVAEAGAIAKRKAEEDAARERTAAFNRLTSAFEYKSAQQLLSDCDKIDSSVFPPIVKTRCGQAHLERAKSLVREGTLDDARVALNSASRELGEPAVADVIRAFNSAQAVEWKRHEAESSARWREEQQKEALARKVYGAALREKFLKDNLDIKVAVTGDKSDQITLTFVLFNDVWRYKFEKGDLLQEMGRLGFKRIDLKDGYDYHRYWTFN